MPARRGEHGGRRQRSAARAGTSGASSAAGRRPRASPSGRPGLVPGPGSRLLPPGTSAARRRRWPGKRGRWRAPGRAASAAPGALGSLPGAPPRACSRECAGSWRGCLKMEHWGEPQGWGREERFHRKRPATRTTLPPSLPSTPPSLRGPIFLFPTKHLNRPLIPDIAHPFFFLPPRRDTKNKEEILQSRGLVPLFCPCVLREDTYSKSSLSTCASFPRNLKPLVFCRKSVLYKASKRSNHSEVGWGETF